MRGLLLSALSALALTACGSPGAPTGPTDGPGSTSSSPASSPTPWASLPRPNVLLVVADDLGWGDLGIYGSRIRTPAIDSLAEGGVRLTSFYTNTPICSASRASIQTGRWAPRTGIPWNPPLRLHADEVTVAQVLRTAGYATALVGKWHLGFGAADMPIHYGYDYYEGLPNGADMKEWTRGDHHVHVDLTPDQVTERYTDLALAWVDQVTPGRPWFLVVSHRDPHTPLIPATGFAGRSGLGLYEDVVTGLDHHVGRLLEGLRARGLEENTLVLFLSDNGPAREPEWPTTGSTGPHRGQKGFCLEGGVRVPAIARWPLGIPAGGVDDAVYSTVDLLPTLVALARATPPARHLDGRVVVGSWMREESLSEGRVALFHSGHPGGYREGRYKLLLDGPWGRGGLYDLGEDPGERLDLAPQLPDVADRLEAAMVEVIR